MDAHDGLPAPAALADWVAKRIPSYSSNPKYSARSAYRWQVVVPRIEIERRLQSRANLGQITAIVTVGRASCGRVDDVLVQGTEGQLRISGDSIRSSLGVASNLLCRAENGSDGLPSTLSLPVPVSATGSAWTKAVLPAWPPMDTHPKPSLNIIIPAQPSPRSTKPYVGRN